MWFPSEQLHSWPDRLLRSHRQSAGRRDEYSGVAGGGD